MANVCTQCFSDRELIAFINSQARTGDCDFCDTVNGFCISIDELFDFFTELLSHFQPDINGTMLKKLIQGNWRLFSSLENSNSILNYFLSTIPSGFASADDLVNFSSDILENVGYWDDLKHQLASKRRYITDVGYLTGDLGWDSFFSSQIEIPHGLPLYRARLHHSSGQPPYLMHEMFCPPAAYSPAGRANPSGIPYLYLSDNSDTVLYEVRAAYLDEISIGMFKVDPAVTSPVKISDFTESSSIFHPNSIGDKIKATLLKQKISADLSKPIRRYDSELEYIPTQFICEFIKIYTGVHGIKFRSSLHSTGNNFVIFDQNLMTCIQVHQVRVHEVEINSEIITR